MKLKQALMEGTGYDVDKEEESTMKLFKEVKAKLQDLERFVRSVHSVDPLYYISIGGELKRAMILIDRLKESAVTSKDYTGARV